MTVKITALKEGGFVVSEHQCWIEGVYATEEAAQKAVTTDPDKLAEIWKGVLAVDRDNGMITEDML
jgi:hypothetical protein